MEPENVKPDTGESKGGDPEVADPAVVDPEVVDPKVVDPKIDAGEGSEPRAVDAKAEAKPSQPPDTAPKPVQTRMTQRRFSQVSRRELLKVAPVLALGVFAIPRLQDSLLKKGLGFSDWASEKLFRRGRLAPVFADAEVTPFEKFPINGYDVDDPGVIFENWTLTVGGAVEKAGEYRLAQIQALPRVRQNTRHVCVEGWDVIGRFGGARLSDFLNMIGADTSARFLTVACADDYYESLDMATALHSQTLLCYEMYDQPLTRKHGAPLRLNIPTKVGYKQAKYLTEMKVTNVLEKVGYWEDQGYSSFYGL
jgi:DMSO/TMAO reductase YedYZ molybdopterin-dependent catalytic subunit